MIRVCTLFILGLAVLLLDPSGVNAGEMTCPSCGRCGDPCYFTTRTIFVPVCVTEQRVKTNVVCETVEREQKYTVFERVPQERTFTKEYCYLEQEKKEQEVTEKQCVIVDLPVTRKVQGATAGD